MRNAIALNDCSWLLLCLLTGTSSAIQDFFCPNVHIEPVVLKGKKFFDSEGNYFPIKGIAYYPRPNTGELSFSNSVDFFTDEYSSLWEQDIANFVALGINVVRIYAVDPSKSHDAFMCALQSAGIYVIVGLLADCENCAIGITRPPDCYPARLKNRGQWIINVFSKYTNTLAFSAGNEATIFAFDIADNAPCQKKFMRDMRAFIQKCRKIPASILPRDIPVGMVNWDREREAQTKYFNCRTNASDVYEDAEWYGLNVYQHCDGNAQSINELYGWIRLRNDYTSYNLPQPVIIAEFGCRGGNFPTIGDFETQREWLQIDALYNPLYTDVFAGGVVFEYSAEKRQADGSEQQTEWPYYEYTQYQYGVGFYSPVDCDHTNIFCSYERYPEFELLAQKFADVDVSYTDTIDDYMPKGELPECPSVYAPVTDFVWPSDTSPDELCYVIATETPTRSPSSNTSMPTTAPTTRNPTLSLTKQPTPTMVSSSSDAPSRRPTVMQTLAPASPALTIQPVSSATTQMPSDSPIPNNDVSPSSNQPITSTAYSFSSMYHIASAVGALAWMVL